MLAGLEILVAIGFAYLLALVHLVESMLVLELVIVVFVYHIVLLIKSHSTVVIIVVAIDVYRISIWELFLSAV